MPYYVYLFIIQKVYNEINQCSACESDKDYIWRYRNKADADTQHLEKYRPLYVNQLVNRQSVCVTFKWKSMILLFNVSLLLITSSEEKLQITVQ